MKYLLITYSPDMTPSIVGWYSYEGLKKHAIEAGCKLTCDPNMPGVLHFINTEGFIVNEAFDEDLVNEIRHTLQT